MSTSTHLAGILRQTRLIPEDRLVPLLEKAQGSGATVTDTVVQEGLAQEGVFLQALAPILGLSFMKLGATEIPAEVLQILPTKLVFQYNVVPVKLENGTLTVATSDPFNASLTDMLRMASNKRIRLTLSSSEEIQKAAKRFYGVGAETVDSMMDDNRFDAQKDVEIGKLDLSTLDQDASIVKFVNQIIVEACQQGATDIHFEPMETQLRIRYRVDGVLHAVPLPPQLLRFQAAILSRIKVMANMDIAEKRLPLDGRIGLRSGGQDIDIRVSTMPTVYGESVSLRILKQHGQFIGLIDLGMSERDTGIMQKAINRPNGIILVTGPTGSGKTTSLYAYLSEINTIDQRILTVEDPIEYEMTGVNQVLVRPDIGLTFARALRHFLRQDPDIIMVGEIRDTETAEIAIQAALTGHLVFSTLHTNDAAGAFTRLLDMGVEPFLAASAVITIVAQRLVRVLCKECRSPMDYELAFLKELDFPIGATGGTPMFGPKGCEKCRGTGFKGRTGIFEVLNVTDRIETLVVQRKSTHELKVASMSDGMTTLRQDGWRNVLKGVTTIDEVIRVAEEDQ